MSKLVQALLSGIFFTFLLDFFLFLGIFKNYIQVNDIDLYYNILFADNQSVTLFSLFSVILGYTVIYRTTKESLILIGSLSLISLLTLIEPIGKNIGEAVLMKKNVTIKMEKFSYRGDVLYNGRNKITLYDHQLKKTVTLNKNQIIGEY